MELDIEKLRELRIDASLYNNRLYCLIHDNFSSQSAFCKELGLSTSELGELLRLKKCPLLKHGKGYREACTKIAERFFVDVEELFPIELYKVSILEYGIEIDVNQIPFHECEQIPVEPCQHEEAEASELRDRIEELLETFTPRQKKVIQMRFGLAGYDEHTLEEISDDFEVTKERIRQLEAKVLRRLRHPYYTRKLKDFVS